MSASIGIVDIIILLIILVGGFVGFKEGAIKTLVSVVGLIIVVVLSFSFKNTLSVYFYENLPFINLWGLFKGIQVLNVLFYELLAFVIISSVLTLVYRVILSITGLLESLLKATVILSIPSKILGFIIGLVEYYIWVYLVLFILSLPVISIRDVCNSTVASFMLKETPYVSKYTSKSMEIYDSIHEVIYDRNNKTNKELNEEAMDVMLRYNVITVSSAEKLIERNKVSVNDDSFLDKYRDKEETQNEDNTSE